MQFPSLIGHTAQLYRILRKSSQTGEALASDYFRSKKYIGSKERKLISELVFASLRMASLIEYCSKQVHDRLQLNVNDYSNEIEAVLATCIIGNQTNAINIEAFLIPAFGATTLHDAIQQTLLQKLSFDESNGESWIESILVEYSILLNNAQAIVKANALEWESEQSLQLSAYCAMPEWIIHSWYNHGVTFEEIISICLSLHRSASIGIRVNTNAVDRDAVLRSLQELNIQCAVGAYAPQSIILAERIRLQDSKLYQTGAIEIQDEGSQLISLALNPKPHWRILDYCAGAGGKSLHMAMLQLDNGEIYATDIDFGRLKELRFRAEKAQYSSIELVPMHPQKSGKSALDSLKRTCDAVLVDAPCTGMGTVRRSPNLKWQLKPKHLESIHKKQVEILEKASEYVKSNGVLVYATCSLMWEENAGVVAEFLQHHEEFELSPLSDAFPEYTSNALLGKDNTIAMLSLNPAKHGTDGFFMCRMIRKE